MLSLIALLAAAPAAAAPPHKPPAPPPAAARPATPPAASDQTAMSVTMRKTSHAIMMPDPPASMHPLVSAAGSSTPR